MANPKRLDLLLGELYGGASLYGALVAAFPGKVLGVSTYGPTRPATIWLADSAADSDTEAIQVAALAHVPVPPAPPIDPAAELAQLKSDVATLKTDVAALKDKVGP